MGRRGGRSRARSMASSGAPGQAPDGGTVDQIALAARRDQAATRIRAGSSSRAWNPADLDRMALAPAIACSSSTSPTGGSPASSTSARPTLPRRAVQHRLLCAADAHDGAGDAASSRRLRAHLRRRASLPEPSRTGARAALPRAAPAAAPEAQSGRALALRLPLRGHRHRGLRPHPAIRAPVAV